MPIDDYSARTNLITYDEAAQILQMPRKTLKNKRSTGEIDLPGVVFGHRTVRFVEADVWALRSKMWLKAGIVPRELQPDGERDQADLGAN